MAQRNGEIWTGSRNCRFCNKVALDEYTHPERGVRLEIHGRVRAVVGRSGWTDYYAHEGCWQEHGERE